MKEKLVVLKGSNRKFIDYYISTLCNKISKEDSDTIIRIFIELYARILLKGLKISVLDALNRIASDFEYHKRSKNKDIRSLLVLGDELALQRIYNKYIKIILSFWFIEIKNESDTTIPEFFKCLCNSFVNKDNEETILNSIKDFDIEDGVYTNGIYYKNLTLRNVDNTINFTINNDLNAFLNNDSNRLVTKRHVRIDLYDNECKDKDEFNISLYFDRRLNKWM